MPEYWSGILITPEKPEAQLTKRSGKRVTRSYQIPRNNQAGRPRGALTDLSGRLYHSISLKTRIVRPAWFCIWRRSAMVWKLATSFSVFKYSCSCSMAPSVWIIQQLRKDQSYNADHPLRKATRANKMITISTRNLQIGNSLPENGIPSINMADRKRSLAYISKEGSNRTQLLFSGRSLKHFPIQYPKTA